MEGLEDEAMAREDEDQGDYTTRLRPDTPPGPPRKFYFDGGQVEVVADIVYEFDSDGKQLRVMRLPEGRKNYTKTRPVQFEEFAPLVDWWGQRQESDRAWKVPAAELLAGGCNLDRKNPRAKEDIAHLPPEKLAASILEKEKRIAEIMGRIQKMLKQ